MIEIVSVALDCLLDTNKNLTTVARVYRCRSAEVVFFGDTDDLLSLSREKTERVINCFGLQK